MDESKKETRKKKRSEPVLEWMRKPVDLQNFEERSLALIPCLDHRLQEALEKISIRSLFPVQVAVWEETIGLGSFERDLCINSPTGSGKTLAYALPIVQQLSTRKITCLRALIVLPTRDLALQVKKVFDALAPAVGLEVGLAVGQSSIEEEISVLIKKPKLDIGMSFDPHEYRRKAECAVDILVATPGRLMDHVRATKGFSLRHLCYLVVDETDRFLREEYQSWLPTVLRLAYSDKVDINKQDYNHSMSKVSQLRTFRISGVERGFKDKISPRIVKLVLSATLTQDPSKLSQLELHHPLFLTAGHKRYKLPETLETCTLICESKTKPLCLVALLHSLKGEKCIVFTSSKKRTRRLTTLLKFFGEQPFKFSQFWGQQHQSRRSKTLESFRRGDIDVLISSDAIARGMDVEGVRNVINYDMAPYIKTYIHRAGRTARAGHSGRCFTLLRKNELKRFKEMLVKAGESNCQAFSLPVDLVDQLSPLYESALEKLKEVDAEMKGLKRKRDVDDDLGEAVD